jgi:hypothetical protein
VSQGDTATFPALYQDGVLLTGWTQFVAAGTIPNWQAPTLSSEFYIAAGTGPATEIVPGAILNRALTQAEIMTMIETNALLPRDRIGGNMRGLADPGLNSDSALIWSDPNNKYTIGGGQIVGSSIDQYNSLFALIAGGNAPMVAGQTVRYSVTVSACSGSFILHQGGNISPFIASFSAPGTYSGTYTAISNDSTVNALAIKLNSVGPGSITITALSLIYEGALLQPEITRAAQVLDFGPNRIRGICTAGVRPFGTRPPVPLRGNQTATGFALGLGSTDPLWFETGLITGLRIKQAAATAQTITLRLNSSGGTTIATATTAASTDWQVIALSPAGGFEVSSGDRLHWTLSGPVALDWDLTWTRR